MRVPIRILPKVLFSIVFILAFAGARAEAAENPTVAYRVVLERPGRQVVSVEMRIRGIERQTLDVALPAWTPGSYEILNYAQFLSELEAKGNDLKPRSVRRLDKQTWRIDCAGQDSILLRYRIRCERLTVDSNWLGPKYGQLQGAATFLYVVGNLGLASSVEFSLPAGWNVATSLRETAPRTYSAENFDALADAPMIVGEYHRMDFPVRQARISVVTTRRPANTDAMRDALTRMIGVYADMMGGLPFDRYLFYYVPNAEGAGAFTEGLEHAESTLINYAPEALIDQPTNIDFLTVTAHEFFHVWNVKRLRPRELVPLDYARELYTPSLWFAEGVTDYYAMIGLTRAKLIRIEDFAAYVETNFEVLENSDARRFMSLADASLSTWLSGTSNYQDIPIDYYGKGALVALMLDVEMRARSNGDSSLDDLMRALCKRFSENGPGYGAEDIVAEADRLTGTDMSEFFRRYVTGTDDLPLREVLERIGFRLSVEGFETAYQGYGLDFTEQGPRVTEVISGTPAADAGLAVGDVLLKINGQSVGTRVEYANAGARIKPGVAVSLKVRRRSESLVLTLVPTPEAEVEVSVAVVPSPNPAQAKLRRALFQGGEAAFAKSASIERISTPNFALRSGFSFPGSFGGGCGPVAAAGFKPVVSLREQG